MATKKRAGRDLEVKENIPQLGANPPHSIADTPRPNFTRYIVTRSVSMIAHGATVYPVSNSWVDLPAGESWYTDLIKNGTLKGE